MAPQMQGLAKYIKEAYSPEITTDICPFDTKAGDPGPLLRPKGINRILLYPGSFNPPHKGHLNLLSYVLHNAGQDLQITSAFIILTDNDSLVEKTRNEDRPLILDRKERIDLWRKSGLSTDRVWLFDRTENEWTEFRKRLEDNLQRDDIELKFILLGGPDWIRLECTHDPSYWGCRDSITSDVSRPVNFRYPGNLRQLSGCSMWEGLECDVNRIRRQLQARLRGRSAREIEEAVALAVRQIAAVSVCRRFLKPRGNVRFVPADLDKQPAEAPSSTKLRQAISDCPDENLENKLKSWALSPALLAAYVQEHRRIGQM